MSSSSLPVIAEKVRWLGGAIKGMVAAGQLTEAEREEVLDGMRDRLAELEAKDDEKSVAACEKLREKLAAVKDATPHYIPVPRARELKGVWLAINRIRAAEAGKGGLMSPQAAMELSTLEERERVLAEECRGWLETDEELEARFAPIRPRKGGGGKSKAKRSGGSGSGSGSGSGGGGGSSRSRARGGGRSRGGAGGVDADGWATVGGR